MGRAKHMRIMPGGSLEADKDPAGRSSVFVGRKLDEHRGAFLLEYPMDKGYVTDGGWDAMERLWEVRIDFIFLLGAIIPFFSNKYMCRIACILEKQFECEN